MKETASVVAENKAMVDLVNGLTKIGYSDSAILDLIASENPETEGLVSELRDSEYSDSAILKLLANGTKPSAEVKEEGKTSLTEQELLEHISDIMLELGVPAHIKGYAYVCESIFLAVKDPKVMESVTKVLYPTVAKKFATTSSRVERAVRHAIEVAWSRADVDILHRYFGYTIQRERGKATNSEFVAMIATKLRLKFTVKE